MTSLDVRGATQRACRYETHTMKYVGNNTNTGYDAVDINSSKAPHLHELPPSQGQTTNLWPS